MGVPFIMSAPEMRRIVPLIFSFSILSNLTQESANALGRKEEREAKTPIRSLPPNRGGRMVGDHEARSFSENPQISQRCENSANPRRASSFRYSGSKMI